MCDTQATDCYKSLFHSVHISACYYILRACHIIQRLRLHYFITALHIYRAAFATIEIEIGLSALYGVMTTQNWPTLRRLFSAIAERLIFIYYSFYCTFSIEYT